MRAIAWLRRNPLEAAWAVFAAANWVAMVLWPSWETIPFHFVWISLTLVYGIRIWSMRTRSMRRGRRPGTQLGRGCRTVCGRCMSG